MSVLITRAERKELLVPSLKFLKREIRYQSSGPVDFVKLEQHDFPLMLQTRCSIQFESFRCSRNFKLVLKFSVLILQNDEPTYCMSNFQRSFVLSETSEMTCLLRYYYALTENKYILSEFYEFITKFAMGCFLSNMKKKSEFPKPTESYGGWEVTTGYFNQFLTKDQEQAAKTSVITGILSRHGKKILNNLEDCILENNRYELINNEFVNYEFVRGFVYK